MSNNLYQQSINILNKASGTSNEAERNKLYDQANKIFNNPDFLKSSGSSSNDGSGLTSSPANPNALPRDQSSITFNSVHGNYSLSTTIAFNNICTNWGYKC